MHSNNDQNWGVSWMTSSFHINETPKQEPKKEPDFFFCCFDSVSNTDHFSPTSPSMTLSISNLLHPILNSKETRMPIFRETFKQMVLHALVEVAVLLCDMTEPCQWRPSVGTSNDSIHSTWTYMLKTEIPTYTWHDGTTKFGRTEALLQRVQKLSEHLLVPKHHTVEDLASNQTVIDACRCIAKSLEALPNHDYKRVLGVCEVTQDIFCSITQRENLKPASFLTDEVSVIEQTQYADEFNTRSLLSGGADAGPTTPLVDKFRSTAYNGDATPKIVGNFNHATPHQQQVDLNNIPRDSLKTDARERAHRHSNGHVNYSTKRHPQDDQIPRRAKRQKRQTKRSQPNASLGKTGSCSAIGI